jgi:N-methylhydantoinase A
VTTSSQLSPVIGEYERAMTTILNAYLGPVTSTYIERFNGELGNLGLGARELQIMKCTGGLVPASEAQRSAVSLINSGPVGGLVASQTLGKTLDHENIISTDVGGTSFDVGIIRNGDFAVEKNPFVDKGTPVQIPAADIKTVGAGGGSIVWTKGDRLRVGPKSTGADPGPACYGRGGTDPTLTDILLLLGYMNPEGFWSGRMSLDTDAAEEAIETLTDQLGLSQTEVVTGAYKIAVAKMADLVRKVTVEQGYDPREFVLYSYGGAGPAHAAVYAKELDVKEVIVPQTAPTFSAFGIALADTRRNYAVTDTSSLNDLTADDITDTFAQLEERAHRDIRETNDSPDEYLHSYSVDLRYAGQMNELTVGTERSPTVEDLKASYNETYAMRFGEDAVLDQAEVQAVTYRLDTMKTEVDPDLKAQTDADERAIDPVSTRTMYFPEIGATETPEPVEGKVFDQNELRPGNTFQGPGVVEADKTTIVVPPATDARVDEYNNLRMTWSDSQ